MFSNRKSEELGLGKGERGEVPSGIFSLFQRFSSREIRAQQITDKMIQAGLCLKKSDFFSFKELIDQALDISKKNNIILTSMQTKTLKNQIGEYIKEQFKKATTAIIEEDFTKAERAIKESQCSKDYRELLSDDQLEEFTVKRRDLVGFYIQTLISKAEMSFKNAECDVAEKYIVRAVDMSKEYEDSLTEEQLSIVKNFTA